MQVKVHSANLVARPIIADSPAISTRFNPLRFYEKLGCNAAKIRTFTGKTVDNYKIWY